MQMANSLLQEIQDHLLNAQKQECMINLHYCSREHIYNIKLIYLECELLPLSHNQELLLDQNLSCPCFKYFSQCAHAFCHTHTHTHTQFSAEQGKSKMELSNWKSKKFLVVCTVSTALGMTVLWLSQQRPLEYSKARLPLHVPKGHQTPETLLYRTQEDATKYLQTETQTKTAIKQTRVPPTSSLQTKSLTSPTTNAPTTLNTVTPAPAMPPPVSLRLPSGHLVTPESLSLPESSSDLLITVKCNW